MARSLHLGLGLGILAGCGAALAGTGSLGARIAATDARYAREIRPLMRSYCLGCHSTSQHAGDLDLERFATASAARRDPHVWTRVIEQLQSGEMPPKTARQPTAAERSRLLGWSRDFLRNEAYSRAGDPGPVVLRRLNNAEYRYTIQDLTGVDLDPAREFPADSGAGEGFTNAGGALVMSPSLVTKYFDAAKEIAQHAELLPDGFRFSPDATRSDWTNAALNRIRTLYRRYTDSGGASTVNLQGIVFNTNDGGRLPVERYLAATLEERAGLSGGKKTPQQVALARGLSPKYFNLLWSALNDRTPSLLLDGLRERWRTATPEQASSLTAFVSEWQRSLWRFTTVGQFGRDGGPKAWQEPVAPSAARRDIRLKLPAPDANGVVTVTLSAGDGGDGTTGDLAVWERPRLSAPGRPEILLRDVRGFTRELTARRARLLAGTSRALEAAAEALQAAQSGTAADPTTLARNHELDPELLDAWLDYLGVGTTAPPKLALFGSRQTALSGYAFVNGWGSPALPSLVSNSSDQAVRVPGNLKPHGVCVHPTPTLSACAGWQSPITGSVRISGKVTHAHPECGNGVTWSVEHRRGANRRRLASGVAQGSTAAPFTVAEPLVVRPGDLVSLVIGPRNGDHSCDLTDLELVIAGGPSSREWSLTRDVADTIHAGNPHADRFGTPGVWHFYSEPVSGAEAGPVLPAGSLLARWQAAEAPAERRELAEALQRLLTGAAPTGSSPDAVLHRQLTSLNGPLLIRLWGRLAARPAAELGNDGEFGLDPKLFGRPPSGGTAGLDPASLSVQAPSHLEVRLPAELAAGAELVTGAALAPGAGADGSVQMDVVAGRAGAPARGLLSGAPVLTAENSAARRRFEQGFEAFRALFPIALAYTRIVPVDEVVTLTLFYREDEMLKRLMLSATEGEELERLWSELHFTSQSPLKLVNAYEQITEFATQDRPDLVIAFKPLKKPIYDAAAAFEKAMVAAEPKHLDRLLEFAGRAYRRPLTSAEQTGLRTVYRTLRTEGLPHEDAFRLTLARILTSPTFLYRLEGAPAGAVSTAAGAVSGWELATRLSYFLWSGPPDDQLRAAAASGRLQRPEVLGAQVRRMLKDPRVRRLATEFGCQWLHIYEFDTLDEKSEKLFPEFGVLRKDMYEEAIRFFTDLLQRDGSVLGVFDSDHTFVNGRLAKFYGLPNAASVPDAEWRRVDGLRRQGRGGILGLAATLAKQSGASRTSPILRGNWVSEVLLGERLPRPPKDVPRLPEDETATEGLTVRQLVIRHTSDPKCSGCHRRIDPFGFSLEGFDPIGRRRSADLAGRAIDVKTRTPDGRDIDGLGGLRSYLLQTRRDAVLRQFSKKLLGYALGRSVQLSDEPLLADLQSRLAKNGYRLSTAIEMIAQSKQFRFKSAEGTTTTTAGIHE